MHWLLIHQWHHLYNTGHFKTSLTPSWLLGMFFLGRKVLVPLTPMSTMYPWSSTLSTHPLKTWSFHKVNQTCAKNLKEKGPISQDVQWVITMPAFRELVVSALLTSLGSTDSLMLSKPPFEMSNLATEHLNTMPGQKRCGSEQISCRGISWIQKISFGRMCSKLNTSNHLMTVTALPNIHTAQTLQTYLHIAWIQLFTKHLRIRLTDVFDTKEALQATR